MAEYITKDSGQRVDFPSGMRRDIADDKPNFALCLAEGVAYEDQLLTRWAALMQRGAKKYGDRNWEQANSLEELERFRSSALRHMIQWATGAAPEEDHAAAVVFNLAAYEATRLKLANVSSPEPVDLTLRVGAKVLITTKVVADGMTGKTGTVAVQSSGLWGVEFEGKRGTYFFTDKEFEVIG